LFEEQFFAETQCKAVKKGGKGLLSRIESISFTILTKLSFTSP
jgi:hypothetical protein